MSALSAATPPMPVEIWSDIACPFCFIGKRQFDAALVRFAHRDDVAVTYRSFQLNPALRTDPTVRIEDYLAREKGFPAAQVRAMNARVTEMGQHVGIRFVLDRAVVANTFRAHRLLHLAKSEGRQLEAEERLFDAYFTEGRNVDDLETLVTLGTEIGVDAETVRAALASDAFDDDVRRELAEARQLGVSGVPFFVFDQKYAVSGAQGSDLLLQALAQAYAERGTK